MAYLDGVSTRAADLGSFEGYQGGPNPFQDFMNRPPAEQEPLSGRGSTPPRPNGPLLVGPGTARPYDPLQPDQGGALATPTDPNPNEGTIPVGYDLGVRTTLPEGGTVTTTVRNERSTSLSGPDYGGTPEPTNTGYRMDVRAADGSGTPSASVRMDGNGDVSGAVRVFGNGDGDLTGVVNGRYNVNEENGISGNPTGNAVGVTVSGGGVGGRVQLNNPLGNSTPTGQPGAQGTRVEVYVSPFGADIANTPGLSNRVEVGVYGETSGVPGSQAGYDEVGGFARANGIQSPSLNGDVTISGGQRTTTNAAGVETEGTSLTGAVNLTIGRPGDTQGVLSGRGTTTSAPGGDEFTVYGQVRFPLP